LDLIAAGDDLQFDEFDVGLKAFDVRNQRATLRESQRRFSCGVRNLDHRVVT
jgi:hypothetical protein